MLGADSQFNYTGEEQTEESKKLEEKRWQQLGQFILISSFIGFRKRFDIRGGWKVH